MATQKKKVTKKIIKKKGRPTSFTKELAEDICSKIMEGKSLKSICEQTCMPSQSMVFRWLQSNESFRERYTCARTIQADCIFDGMLDMVDECSNDFMISEHGVKVDNEAIQRSKLRFDARKWVLSKLAPKKYGEKIEVESTNINLNADLNEQEKEDALKKISQATNEFSDYQ